MRTRHLRPLWDLWESTNCSTGSVRNSTGSNRGGFAAAADGALLVDIRYAELRDRDGLIPGALVVERNELEWRLDPLGSHRAAEATSHDLHVVVICNEGYASSLAAVSLRQLGLHRATDLVGGFQAWKAEGLPVSH